MKYDFIRRREEKKGREKRKEPPSLRYLATEILFKGYCIIFLMRFSSFFILVFSFLHRFLSFVFPFKYTFEKEISKIMQVITSKLSFLLLHIPPAMRGNER
jgi:hypothetical protein